MTTSTTLGSVAKVRESGTKYIPACLGQDPDLTWGDFLHDKMGNYQDKL